MQIQSTSVHRKSCMEVTREIYLKDGLLAFWRGNGASCLHRFPYSGITFLVQDRAATILRSFSHIFPAAGIDFTSGAIGGGVAACMTYPLDVVRLRLSSQTGPRPPHCGICDTVNRIAIEQGTRGFYKGLFPTLLHVVPSFAISFQVFGSLKRRYQVSHQSSTASIPLKESFYYGCGAGFFSSAMLFPMDLIRRQMQVDGKDGSTEQYKSISDVVKKVYQSGRGVRGFYNGLGAELVKVVPFVGIMFMTVEWLKGADWPFEKELRRG